MNIYCYSCNKRFETEDEEWRHFINEAKKDGWIFVHDPVDDDWMRFCSKECMREANL